MRVLVTGASGFIGKNLLLAAPRQWRITAVYHRDARFPAFVRAHGLRNVRPLRCDLSSAPAVRRLGRRAGRDFDLAIYLAGHVNPARSMDVPLEDAQANIVALLNTLETFRLARCLYVSSGAVYEGLTGAISPRRPVSPTLPYAIAKVAAEQYVKYFAERRGSVGRYAIVRFFGAFGPYEPARKIYTRLVQTFALEGRSEFTLRGDGTNHIDAMYVDDAVRGLLRIVARPWRSNLTVDFAYGRPLPMRALAERAARVFGQPHARIRCEGRTHEVLHCRASRTGMRRQFGFEPRIRLEDGLQRLAAFLRSRHD